MYVKNEDVIYKWRLNEEVIKYYDGDSDKGYILRVDVK